jgi:hypothetical protein
MSLHAARIYDNPNHPRYGPVRRLWIILVQLDLLEEADCIKWHDEGVDHKWDEALAYLLDHSIVNESHLQAEILRRILEITA